MMNRVDLIIFLIILIFMLFGYWKGLVKSVLSVVQYFAVVFLSISLAPELAKILIEKFNLDLIIVEWAKNNENLFSNTISIIGDEFLKNISGRIINVLAVILLFIALKIVFSLLILILNKIANLPILSVANKMGGLVLGVMNGILIAYLLIVLINWLPFENLSSIRGEIRSSFIGPNISLWVPEVAAEVISMVKTSV